MLVLDALRRLEDGDEFQAVGLELSAAGVRRRIPSKLEITSFAKDPATFLEQNEVNLDALIIFALLTGWALAGCEPNHEAELYQRIDFSTSTPQRHQAFALRSVLTIKRLLAFRMPFVYVCGVGHLKDLVSSPFLKRQFYILPVGSLDPNAAPFQPSSGNLVLVKPVTTLSENKLIAGYLAKQHKDLLSTALKGVTARLFDPS
jgi:hypothetical protein